jgi:carbonic anhydrase/acetyltransferase-like protein (isoleucine patch superfamily)
MFGFFRVLNVARGLLFRLTIAPFLGGFGLRTTVLRPRGIEGISRVYIGDDVYVSDGALLAAVPLTGAALCELRIGNGCKLGRNNHIYATGSVIFEDDVLTANNVYVSDNGHDYRDHTKAIRLQAVRQFQSVRIGQGSWLGQNVCVIGASVGRGCVVGANSVVLEDIPDFSIAVGSPARVVKRLDPQSGAWESVAISQLPGERDT